MKCMKCVMNNEQTLKYIDLADEAKSIIDARIDQIEQALEESKQRMLERNILIFNYEQKTKNQN